jgi:ABC-type amino acid transport substrate-binding protein
VRSLVLVLLLLPGVASAQVIRVSAGDFLAPQVPAVEALLREAGFQSEVRLAPAARSLLMLQNGEVDAEFFRQPGALAAFRDRVHLVGPLSCSTNYAFVSRGSSWPVEGLEDLRGRRIGVLNGNQLITGLLERAGMEHQLFASRDSMFQMLLHGRLDVVIEPERSGLTVLQQLGLTEHLEHRGDPLTDVPNYLVLRTHLREWGPRLDEAAARVLRTGLWHRWIGEANERLGIPRQVGLGCLTPP